MKLLVRDHFFLGQTQVGKRRGHVRFAVAAPWSVEFNEDVLVVVYNNFFIVVGNNNLNGAVLGLGNRL